MLNVIFYQNNQDLLEQLSSLESILVICPSPSVADNLRSLATELEVLTISKWTSDHLKGLNLDRTRKSELMLRLAAVWRVYFPEEKTSRFHEAFELFTELRSFTLNLELLNEFFQELDEVVHKSILLFWAYLNNENLIDEHLAYLKIPESQKHKAFSMVGFKHMSGVQIDMLRTIGENHEVYVFLPNSVFDEALSSDWIKWLPVAELPEREELDEKLVVHTIVLPQGKTNIGLERFFKEYPQHDVILSGSNLGITAVQEVQNKETFFKINEEIFLVEVEKFVLDFKEHFLYKNAPIELIKEYIEGAQKDSLLVANYKKYKICELFLEAFSLYTEFHQTIDNFAIDIFEMVVGLNSPRVSLVSINKENKRNILDLGSIHFRDEEKAVALYASKNLSGFNLSEKILSEAMTKALRAIGPIKRSGLDFIFQKHEIFSILSHPHSILIIEDELLLADIAWRNILKRFEPSFLDIGIKYKLKTIREYLAPKMRKGPIPQELFSATKIQKFLDCPRSYYFSYVEKIDHRPEERTSLGADEMGRIKHKIIEKYFSADLSVAKEEINYKKHANLSKEVFDTFLLESKLTLSLSEYENSLNLVMHHSSNGISYLLNFMSDKEVQVLEIEKKLPSNPWKILGDIDCFIQTADGTCHVLDFKSSQLAIGTRKETENLDKVQIWIYIMILKSKGFKIGTYGYLNLSEVSESLIFNENGAKEFDENSFSLVNEKIELAMKQINETVDFRDNPRKNDVCNVCVMNLFCLKGGICE